MRLLPITLILAMLLLMSACVTRTQRDWGYVDTGSQVTASTTLVPLGSSVPPEVAAMQNTVSSAPPAFAQPYMANNAYTVNNPAAVNSNRITYEHNTEEFDANTLINLGFLGLGVANTILRFDHLARHPHGWYRWW